MIVDDSEDGPYDVLHLIRFFLGERGTSPERRYMFEPGTELNFWWNAHYQVYRAMSCIWCATFWFGLVASVVYLIYPLLALIVLFPFALSSAALVAHNIAKRLG